MDVEIRQFEVRGVAVFDLSGTVTDANAAAFARQVIARIDGAGVLRAVVDNRKLVRNLSLASVYFLMQALRPLANPRCRTVLVERPEARAFAEFHRITSANAGVRFEVMYDLDEAIDALADGGGQDGRSATHTIQSDPPSA